MRHIIRQGQFVAPRHAAESYIGAEYVIVEDGATYSAHPGDYWDALDSAPLGALVRRLHPYLTVTGARITSQRVLKSRATVGDLRRLARAATPLVRKVAA